jgi:hypothetical protein
MTLAQVSGMPSEGDDCSDCGLHEGVGECARELVNGFPAGAVSGEDTVDPAATNASTVGSTIGSKIPPVR